jgi:hypothetical protein
VRKCSKLCPSRCTIPPPGSYWLAPAAAAAGSALASYLSAAVLHLPTCICAPLQADNPPSESNKFLLKLFAMPPTTVKDPTTGKTHSIDPQNLAHRILQVCGVVAILVLMLALILIM